MHPTRRSFLGGTLAAGAGLTSRPALASEELKLATFVPPTHIIMAKVLMPWAQEIAGASGNRLTVRMFPSMQLGGKPPSFIAKPFRAFPTSASRCPGTHRPTSR